MSEEISIDIGGTVFTGWENISIQKSLDTLCAGFSFGYSDNENSILGVEDINEGDSIKIFINNILYLTGRIDEIDITDTTFNAKGREATSVIVDGSSLVDKNEMKNVSFKSFISTLLNSYGLEATILSPVNKTYKKIRIGTEEKVFEIINKKLRDLNLRMITTPDGRLEILAKNPIPIAVPLQLGFNIKSYTIKKGLETRYSDYLVKSKAKTGGRSWESVSFFTKGEAQDSDMPFFKFKAKTAEEGLTNSECKKRAEYERDMGIANSQAIGVSVFGYFQTDTKLLWPLDALVKVVMDKYNINASFVIKTISIVKDSSGSFTDMTLTPKVAFHG